MTATARRVILVSAPPHPWRVPSQPPTSEPLGAETRSRPEKPLFWVEGDGTLTPIRRMDDYDYWDRRAEEARAKIEERRRLAGVLVLSKAVRDEDLRLTAKALHSAGMTSATGDPRWFEAVWNVLTRDWGERGDFRMEPSRDVRRRSGESSGRIWLRRGGASQCFAPLRCTWGKLQGRCMSSACRCQAASNGHGVSAAALTTTTARRVDAQRASRLTSAWTMRL